MSQFTPRICPKSLYIKGIEEICARRNVEASAVLAGADNRLAISIRWSVWKQLSAAGYSYNSIGRVSGYDHTAVRYACLAPCRRPFNYKGRAKNRRRISTHDVDKSGFSLPSNGEGIPTSS